MLRMMALGLLLALGFTACQRPVYTADALPPHQLVFGSGGGMAGQLNAYILLENGQIFRLVPYTNAVGEALPRAKAREAEALFADFEAVYQASPEHNQPGNRYYFLRRLSDAHKHNLVWSDEAPAPPAFQDFYRRCMALVTDKN